MERNMKNLIFISVFSLFRGRIILYDKYKIAVCLQSKVGAFFTIFCLHFLFIFFVYIICLHFLQVGTTSILKMFLNLLPEKYEYLKNDTESLHREMSQIFSLKKKIPKITLKGNMNCGYMS